MFRPQRQGTISTHIPTAHDCRPLGRNDPVWPRYVQVAADWDKAKIESWNKAMDVLLLFAALFSAVVTAFLIESSKNLKPDYQEITAVTMTAMLEVVQAAILEQQPPLRNDPLPSVSTFQLKNKILVVNALWFVSLALSMTVALVAMLVKTWGEIYTSGNSFSPAYVQARTRQARYDKLESWRTENVVLALPTLMHFALALFLSGLMLFLHDLNFTLFKAAIAIPAIALLLYLGTALLPLWVSFCPYNTPLLRSIGSILYLVFYGYWCNSVGNSRFTLPCQRKEKRYSEQTTPDSLTAQAIEWLIMHSPDEESIDDAIKALSGSAMNTDVWKYLSQESLIAFVAQKFTSLFQIVDPSTKQLELKSQGASESNLSRASSYGQALANLIRQLNSNLIVNAGGSESNGDIASSKMTLNKEQAVVVERGLSFLAFGGHNSNEAKSTGITSISAWYTSTTRTGQSREEWKSIVEALATLLSPPPTNSDPDMTSSLGQTLAVEISYWRWDLSQQETESLLKSAIQVFTHNPRQLQGPARMGLSATLAVLALMFNDYAEISPKETQIEARKLTGNVLMRRGNQATGDEFQLAVFYQQSEEEFKRSCEYLDERQKRKILQRVWRARWIARAGTINPKFLDKYSDELLLLGLPGVLQLLVELGQEQLVTDFASFVESELSILPSMKKRESVTLPYILPATFDIKSKAIDTIIQCLNSSFTSAVISPLTQSALLGCLLDKTDTWKHYGPQILDVVLKLLPLSETPKLQEQCMIALEEYWLTHLGQFPSQPVLQVSHSWRLFFEFGIPLKLVRIYRDGATDADVTSALRSRAKSVFHSIMHAIPQDDTFRDEAKVEISKVLNQLAIDGDSGLRNFATLAGKFLSDSACARESPCKQSTWWKDQITQWTSWFPDQHTLTTRGQYSLELIQALCIDYERNQDFNRFTHLLEARV